MRISTRSKHAKTRRFCFSAGEIRTFRGGHALIFATDLAFLAIGQHTKGALSNSLRWIAWSGALRGVKAAKVKRPCKSSNPANRGSRNRWRDLLLRPNRGDWIRTSDLLVPNQAL